MIAYLLNVPTWGSATLFEMLWLVAGIIALVVGVGNIVDAHRDLLSLPHAPTKDSVRREMLEIVAKGNITDEALRLVIAAMIVTTGTIGVVTPNPAGGRVTLTGLAVTMCLVAIAIVSAARGIVHTHRRHTLYELSELELQRIGRRKDSPPQGVKAIP